MNQKIRCPVCLNSEGGSCTPFFQSCTFECEICGYYRMEFGLCAQVQASQVEVGPWRLTPVQRAVLSHRVRTKTAEGPKSESDFYMITPDVLDSLRSNGLLPNPAIQAANIIRFVGDSVSRRGEPIPELPGYFHASIGALTHESAVRLVREMEEQGIIRSDGAATFGHLEPTVINLSLDGWNLYQAQQRGSFKGNYGFIAMEFDDSDLEPFVYDVVKPTVKTATGYDLVDMRDVAEAGIIDNIMRIRIREARFVIVDLTHDNNGAYWEAGYAEGLGKPVIYICEKTKFDRDKTHFDTNHCTTVPWSRDDVEQFKLELGATLRRSLDLSG